MHKTGICGCFAGLNPYNRRRSRSQAHGTGFMQEENTFRAAVSREHIHQKSTSSAALS